MESYVDLQPEIFKCLLPCNPCLTVEDPLSICEEYDSLEVSKWRLITAFITKMRQTPAALTIVDLTDMISSFRQDAEFNTLSLVFRDHVNPEHFMSRVLPSILSAALRMPELFPHGEVEVLHPGREHVTSFSREQIACLLSHMFLCTIDRPHWNSYWANFHIWYSAQSPPVLAYLQSLLAYFAQLDPSGKPVNPSELVTFHRRVLTSPPDWQSSSANLSQIVPSYSLEPEVDAEVDFANRDVGFGVSGTQEEVKLAMSPETCVVMLIAPTLQDNETLLIQGARKIGLFEGIGRNVKYVRSFPQHRDWSSRFIIAMDALELDTTETQCCVPDLREENLKRELNKAYCGFAPIGDRPFPSIATGHWGCGAFGGHRYAKALIQVMAAAEAKTRLVFHDIQGADSDRSDSFLQQLMDFIEQIMRHKVTVGQLYVSMIETGKQIELQNIENPDVFVLLSQNLQL